MLRAVLLARRAVAVLAMRVRDVTAVTAADGLREARAKRIHALKDQGERKQQLERGAFHAGDTLRSADLRVEALLSYSEKFHDFTA